MNNLKGPTNIIATKYNLQLGTVRFDDKRIGGGAIYIECDSLKCQKGNILSLGSLSGGGGTIYIKIKNKVEFSGDSKIESYYNGVIKIQCNKKYHYLFKRKNRRYKSAVRLLLE